MKESDLSKLILLAVSKFTKAKIFRNNTGTGWVGKSARTKDGGIYLAEPRPLHAGLTRGSSDFIGWTEREITPDMVGKKVAIFTAVEVKEERGRISREQLHFIDTVQRSGGIAGIVRSEDDAINLLNNYGV